jgi:cysteine synthase
MPQQFKNPANPAIHEQTTGPEIWDDTDGASTCWCRRGHRRHDHRRLALHQEHARARSHQSVAVEPKESPVISQKLAGQELKPGPHKIQGIGAGFIPDTLDLSLVDRVEQVDSAEAVEMARRLATEEGMLCRHLLRRGRRRRGAAGERRIRGQDHRGGPARRGRALPLHGALRGHRRVTARNQGSSFQ